MASISDPGVTLRGLGLPRPQAPQFQPCCPPSQETGQGVKTSLYNISITNCLLTESDLAHLSQCWNICQLKGLNLNGVTLTNFHPELLQVLLEKVASTLEELDLNLCGIMDSHLMAILPVLSSCSQLRVLSLCGNLISMTVLESLLRHTDRLSALSLELYPAPRESYSFLGILNQERLAQLKAELWQLLTDLGHPRKIWIRSEERRVGKEW